jgi:hypothetical protein
MVVERLADGSLRMNRVAVFTCGCAGTVPETKQLLRLAGVPEIPMVVNTTNQKVRKFIQQVGLDSRLPAINKGKHSILYNPFTRQYIDLFKVQPTETVLSNIQTLAEAR